MIGGAEKYMAVCRTCYNLPDRRGLTRTPLVQTTPTRGDADLARQLVLDTPPDTPPYDWPLLFMWYFLHTHTYICCVVCSSDLVRRTDIQNKSLLLTVFTRVHCTRFLHRSPQILHNSSWYLYICTHVATSHPRPLVHESLQHHQVFKKKISCDNIWLSGICLHCCDWCVIILCKGEMSLDGIIIVQ